ncbi:flagellar biosynthesis protein FlhF [Bacillus cihuensis]|uniref:flagellar biosynthesis protein FlhF n=1 Tax=Bacillus cihuensis TaxID=1208599 RepID=UPI0004247992|nr:flagellar biosynthesis protein FlhF [Bacillus cihuensis]
MNVKRYQADSMTEALKMVREELGNDAVILNSKPIFTGGFLGMFKKRSIEVYAAVDPQIKPTKQVTKQKTKKIAVKAAETVIEENRFVKASTLQKSEPIHKSNEVMKELVDLKAMIKELKQVSDIAYPEPLLPVNELLVGHEINQTVQRDVMDKVLENWSQSHTAFSEAEILKHVKAELVNRFANSKNWGFHSEKKYINIVGPTGVGKTTTLAKVAAHCMLKQNKRVAFITTDTYRIAAIDQLKTYAKILNVPIEVAYNLEDFQKAIERFSHYDVVFIDTAGRNFRNADYVRDLKNIIDFSVDMETYLVLSLTAKQKDMEDIYNQFSMIPIKQVIFTKADETSTYGAMVNFIIRNEIGVAYITNGQNVPDDIEIATPQLLAKMILGEINYA